MNTLYFLSDEFESALQEIINPLLAAPMGFRKKNEPSPQIGHLDSHSTSYIYYELLRNLRHLIMTQAEGVE